MDNLGPVPKSATGKDMILIVIDRLTKMARFIPTYSSVTSKGTADLFLQEVFRHHGLPSNIISDRDPHFTAKFWEALQKVLGVQLLMSTAAHPQTDGQSEAIVWGIGAGSTNRLMGFDGDTGQFVFTGGGPTDAMSTVGARSTAIAAKGRIFVAADANVYAFTTR